ncbi:AraC family transcriptional regulator [Bradyrhizobium neotropicale]|uniref:AraC family transcriptional regulator n=1 Tax=Bradyrhizobium neotropicale TaxID=1497615 RepID=UPI001AD70CA2|nr:AraC family transcriptional regulator [Bradyrhizobium neotropicale]MBO4227128.1 helix-turn-helix domain-containing protein [Bradyrhizobium neotropicale]
MNSTHKKLNFASQPEQPASPGAHGFGSYGASGLLASSTDRGWSGITAELRSHGSGTIAWKSPQPDIEICIDVRGNGSVVTRERYGITDRSVSERGTIWVSPPVVEHGLIDLSDPVPAVLHIYLPPSRFSPESFGEGLAPCVVTSLRHESSFRDPLLAEIAYALTSELERETSAGRLLAETLASSLAARLVQNHFGKLSLDFLAPREGLDRRRLARVLDYIETNLEGELTVGHLASIACLSQFHFARAFKAAVGRSPHRYVSARRLERAKELLGQREQPLADIALRLRFSCQANFTRAFRQATGLTPAQYRRSVVA